MSEHEVEDKWERVVSQTIHTMLRHEWKISLLHRNELGSYIAQAKRGKWQLEFVASAGLTDEGALVDADTKDVLRLRDVRTVAAMNDATLDGMWKDAVGTDRIFYGTTTSEVADMAKEAPYGTAAAWRELPGLKPETLDALAVAGVVSMHQLELRSDQQLLAVKGIGPDGLAELKAELVKLVGPQFTVAALVKPLLPEGRVAFQDFLPGLRPETVAGLQKQSVVFIRDLAFFSDKQLLAWVGTAGLADLTVNLQKLAGV